jgi:hypothetical protein
MGDLSKSCAELKTEHDEINNQLIPLQKIKKESRLAANVSFVVLAIFTLGIPLLFVDFSGKDKKKIESYKNRLAQIKEIGTNKNCLFALAS